MKVVKILLLILLALVILAGTFAGGAAYATYYIINPMGGDEPVRVDIPPGAYASDVGELLVRSRLVRDARLFRLTLRLTKSEKDLKPGTYFIDPNQNMMEIINQLKTGHGKIHLVTIPEGLVLDQIARLLEKEGIITSQDFHEALRDNTYRINGEEMESLEGYLLPDTYDFPRHFEADDVISTMVDDFNRRVVPIYNEKKKNMPRELTLHQVITLASMVEREAQVASERPKIAQVYFNRMDRNMRLECDATVQFALGKQKEVLTYRDLEVDSPYNTYLHPGLPPGPIASPGLDSVNAVLDPEPNPYLFYVRNDVKNDGSHVFGRNYSEHQENIRNYQR